MSVTSPNVVSASDKPVIGIYLSSVADMQFDSSLVDSSDRIINDLDPSEQSLSALSMARLGHAMPAEFEDKPPLGHLWSVGMEARAFAEGFSANPLPSTIIDDQNLLVDYQISLNARTDDLQMWDAGGPPFSTGEEYQLICDLQFEAQFRVWALQLCSDELDDNAPYF